MTDRLKRLFRLLVLFTVGTSILAVSSISTGCGRHYSHQQFSQWTELDFHYREGGILPLNSDEVKSLGIGKSPQIFLLTDNRSLFKYGLENSRGLLTMNRWTEMNVDNQGDYSNSFVVLAFREITGKEPYSIIITDIWQNKNTIYVRAQFVDYDYPSGEVSSEDRYLALSRVIVKKEKMPRFGRTIVRLLDDYGVERVFTTVVIPAPESEKNEK